MDKAAIDQLIAEGVEFLKSLSNYEKYELIFYISWPVLSVIVAHLFKINYLSLILLSFGVPSAVLFRKLNERKHFLYFTVIFSVALSPLLDYLAHASDLWLIQTSLPRILRYARIESLLWGFFITFYTVGFYERYFRTDNHNGFGNSFYILHLLAAASIILIPLESILPKTLYLPHLYTIGMIFIFLLPLADFLHINKANHKGLWLSSLYFYYVNAMHEIAALLNNVWKFPLGQNTAVIGSFQFLNYNIPFEEVTLYFFFLAPSLIAYYELLSKREK